MRQIKEFNPDAKIWLRKIPLDIWTMSHDRGYHYNQVTMNMIESFSGLLRSTWLLPITTMVECIYYRSVKFVTQRRTQTLFDLQNGHVYYKTLRELFYTVGKKHLRIRLFLIMIKGVSLKLLLYNTKITMDHEKAVTDIMRM